PGAALPHPAWHTRGMRAPRSVFADHFARFIISIGADGFGFGFGPGVPSWRGGIISVFITNRALTPLTDFVFTFTPWRAQACSIWDCSLARTWLVLLLACGATSKGTLSFVPI